MSAEDFILSRELADARRERDEARATNARLNRRCQEAEAALKARLDSPLEVGRTFGRVCANAAASMYKRERDAALSQVAALRSHLVMEQRFYETRPAIIGSSDFDARRDQERRDMARQLISERQSLLVQSQAAAEAHDRRVREKAIDECVEEIRVTRVKNGLPPNRPRDTTIAALAALKEAKP